MRRPRSRARRHSVVVTLVVGVAVLAGCTASPAAPTPTSIASSASPTPTPTGPSFVPEGSAADNLPLFTQVMNDVAATDAHYQGRAYIDALVAAGFPKAEMEVTNDLTSVGNQADSIQFSVRWAGECLVGQVGPSTKVPTALVLPLVSTGTCLIGQTRAIDW